VICFLTVPYAKNPTAIKSKTMICSPRLFPIPQYRYHAGDTGMKKQPTNLNLFKYNHSLNSKDTVNSHIVCSPGFRACRLQLSIEKFLFT